MALIKCKECGHEVSDKASACPNCGCPIINVYPQTYKTQNKSSHKKSGVPRFLWCIIVIFVILFVGLIIGISETLNSKRDNVKLANSLATIEDYSTIDKTKKLLEGSIWTYTSPIGEDDKFNMWCKLVFKNGKLYYYMVSPSEGDWGTPEVCDYTVEEERYSNTGERFISVNWHASFMDYSFVPETTAIYYKGNYKFILGAHLTKEDRNPWH